MTDHKQVWTRYPFTDELIEVDEGILEILELLWSLGCETTFSCEGDEEHFAYIAFRPSRVGYKAIRDVIHSMALPYVWWGRHDPWASIREGDPQWAVYWVWDWSIYVRIQALLEMSDEDAEANR